jgi:hypothetical protein
MNSVIRVEDDAASALDTSIVSVITVKEAGCLDKDGQSLQAAD